MKDHKYLLEAVYNKASTCNTFSIPKQVENNLAFIAKNAKKQKGVFTVLTTLLIHKIYDSKQDIRRHQSSMKNGFSGRSIDTKYITPTLKKLGLPAMAESGWLTRSLEQPQPYDLNYRGKIQNIRLKTAFLKVIEFVQKNPKKAKKCAVFLIYSVKGAIREKININKLKDEDNLDIEKIISFLNECFTYKYKGHGGSKIPVIAIYSIFTIFSEGIGTL